MGAQVLELIIYYQIRSGSISSPWQMEQEKKTNKKTNTRQRSRKLYKREDEHPPQGPTSATALGLPSVSPIRLSPMLRGELSSSGQRPMARATTGAHYSHHQTTPGPSEIIRAIMGHHQSHNGKPPEPLSDVTRVTTGCHRAPAGAMGKEVPAGASCIPMRRMQGWGGCGEPKLRPVKGLRPLPPALAFVLLLCLLTPAAAILPLLSLPLLPIWSRPPAAHASHREQLLCIHFPC